MNEKEIELNKILGQIYKMALFADCFIGNSECTKGIIQAHSISNKKVFGTLSKSGHLITHKPSTNGSVVAEKIGKRKASTFTGFCDLHDKVFHPIDNSKYQAENLEQNFLFVLRIAAREFYTKRTQLRGIETIIGLINGTVEPVSGLEISRLRKDESFMDLLEYQRIATLEAVNVMNEVRLYLLRLFERKMFHRVNTHLTEFEVEYGLAVASGFLLRNDLRGDTINDLLAPEFTYPKPTYLTIFPQNGKTFILTSNLSRNNKWFRHLIEDIKSSELDRQKTVFSNIIAVNCENTFFSEDYWNNFDKSVKSKITYLFANTVEDMPEQIIVDETLNMFQ